jgi:uncharacterized protein YkwD
MTIRFARKLSIIFVIATCGLHAASQDHPNRGEKYLLDAANRERRAQHLHELRWDPALARAATRHANEMAKHNTISHQFPDEPGLGARVTKAGVHFASVAENVAEAKSPVTIHNLWMGSEGHRANILDKDMEFLGVAVVERGGNLFAVEDFCRKR